MNMKRIIQRHQPGVLTDKPLQIGGTEGRRDATARGGVITVREACKAPPVSIRQGHMRFRDSAMQGNARRSCIRNCSVAASSSPSAIHAAASTMQTGSIRRNSSPTS